MANVIGWTITAIVILASLIRYLTVALNHAFLARKRPFNSHRVRYAFTGIASALAVFAIVGSIWLPLPGLYGPSVLVLAVLWQINDDWKIRYLPWGAPIEYGLHDGERALLAGGSLATLIAYLWTIPY